MQNPSGVLKTRLLSLGAIQPVDFLSQALPAIRSWLTDMVLDNLPPKDDVLRWLGEALRQVLEAHEFPFADDFLDESIRSALVTLAAALYDQLAGGAIAV